MIDKTKQLIIILVVVVISLSIFLFTKIDSKADEDNGKVCFEDRCFIVEVVEKEDDRNRGLMYRESLDANKGMLFIFDYAGVYPFWMKNTLIPLDIIWINEDKEVVYIANAVPCKNDPCPNYDPGKEALYVLEVNAGATDQINIEKPVRFK